MTDSPVRPVLRRLRALLPTVSVSVISADLMALAADLSALERAGASMLHFDVMDGSFVPMLTAGPWYVKGVRSNLLKDVHLMVSDPVTAIDGYLEAGADAITIHVESTVHAHRALQQLREAGRDAGRNASGEAGRDIVRGIALNPATPLEAAEPLLADCDIVYLLAVNPGWGGQRFIPGTIGRAEKLRRMIEASGHEVLVGIDGGVTKANIAEVAATGADVIVSGSAIFEGKDPESTRQICRFMLDAVRGGRRR